MRALLIDCVATGLALAEADLSGLRGVVHVDPENFASAGVGWCIEFPFRWGDGVVIEHVSENAMQGNSREPPAAEVKLQPYGGITHVLIGFEGSAAYSARS